MLVRHLSYFVALARERHFARAAEVCHITQPTLSAAIRKLEEDLGVPLVVRGHRFTGLTAEGEKLLAWSRQILADYQSLIEDLSGARKGIVGELRLGVIPAAMPVVAFVTERFCKANPLATVTIRSITSRAIAESLDAFELDGGLTYLDNEPINHVQRVPLYRERYKLAVSRDHKFAARKAVRWLEAAGERLCLLSQDMQNRRIIDRLTSSIGLTVHPAIVSNSFLAVCAHLRHGGWASIVPHSFFHVFGQQPDLVAIDLVEPAHSEAVGLVISAREPRSPMASALLAATLEADIEGGLASL
ncbi:LysR family transcriptional regulator [Sphingobium sp. H39-3-25]|uniref:LysR family transcriptional regulator n=1 Tax=Sphingomonadales TaxID=204457 RepID=UPI00082BE4AA|nr:LysR family transcriptional regulator [Novosphingobium naphthalenivorans]MDF0545204.1 LysR family transcriptional regulator [Sphingobium arseniciresistens]